MSSSGGPLNGPNSLSASELSEFKEIFDLVDKDGGGSISKEELGELMDTLGINASQEEIDLMVNEIDTDNNGEIDFEEFVAVMSRKVNATYTPEQVKNAFKTFETEEAGSGHVSVKELEKALVQFSTEKITPEQAQELLSQLEPDMDGRFNYVEYVNMMLDNG